MSEAQKYPVTAEMKMMWQTPILYVNVAALVGSMDVPRFNARLAVAILHEYNTLVKANAHLNKDGISVADANQAFFDWQRKGGWKNFETVKEFALLEEFFQAATDKFLKAAGVPDVRFILCSILRQLSSPASPNRRRSASAVASCRHGRLFTKRACRTWRTATPTLSCPACTM